MTLVDLHLHTTHSDGRAAPAELIALAAARRLQAVAITDHDTVHGLATATAVGRTHGIVVVAGIELTATWQGRTCHLLGYGLDPTALGLREALQAAQARAAAAVERGLAALQARGIVVERVALAGIRTRYPSPTALLLAVVRGRRLRSRTDLLALLPALRAGAPILGAAEAIRLLHAAGGAAVLAHPGRRARGRERPDDDLRVLAAWGLDGVEVWHPAHSPDQQAHYAALAAELELVPTGGSDWHGRRRDPPPGSYGAGGDTLDRLLARAHQHAVVQAQVAGAEPAP